MNITVLFEGAIIALYAGTITFLFRMINKGMSLVQEKMSQCVTKDEMETYVDKSLSIRMNMLGKDFGVDLQKLEARLDKKLMSASGKLDLLVQKVDFSLKKEKK